MKPSLKRLTPVLLNDPKFLVVAWRAHKRMRWGKHHIVPKTNWPRALCGLYPTIKYDKPELVFNREVRGRCSSCDRIYKNLSRQFNLGLEDESRRDEAGDGSNIQRVSEA